MDKNIEEFDQENTINLCDSCEYEYPDCPRVADKIFGTGEGNDNICCCNEYVPITTRKNYYFSA